MSTIAYSDMIKSLSSPQGKVKDLVAFLEKSKKDYEEELLYKKLNIMFFGYNIVLPNSTPSYVKKLCFKNDISKEDLLKEIEKEIKGWYVRKRKGCYIEGVEYYTLIKYFDRLNPLKITEQLINKDGIRIMNNHFGLCFYFDTPSNIVSLSEFEIDLSK